MKKYIVLGLIAVAAIWAVATSAIVWHQSETPKCIA